MEELASMEDIKNQVMHAVSDRKLRVIAVVGMGGMGRTTLMHKIQAQVKRTNIFKYCTMVTISRNSSVTRIQDEIAETIGLQIDPRSGIRIRANAIHRKLRFEKSCLVIIDDLWDVSVLADVGIPIGEFRSGCKLLVTTRRETICDEICANKTIRMTGLSKTESWNLFKTCTRGAAAKPYISPIADKVNQLCKGSPLAVTIVGKSLRKEEREHVWKAALRYLESSSSPPMEGYDNNVVNAILFGSSHLPSKDHQSCLLYCTLYPENDDIHTNDLLCYGIGEGLFKDKTCSDVVGNLKDSGLLLEGKNSQHVKTHDVIREVLLETHKHFHVEAGVGMTGFKKWDSVKDHTKISLMSNKILDLPLTLECNKLETLLLQNNIGLSRLHEDFFNMMRNMSVLDLSCTNMSKLPTSLKLLAKLQVLCLNHCVGLEEEAISGIGALVRLQALSLRGIRMGELPEGFGELTSLRLLDLSDTKIKIIRANVVPKLVGLEYLFLHGSFDGWEEEEGKDLAPFSELVQLKALKKLHVCVKNPKILGEEAILTGFRNQLESFVVWGGQATESICSRCMKTMKLNSI